MATYTKAFEGPTAIIQLCHKCNLYQTKCVNSTLSQNSVSIQIRCHRRSIGGLGAKETRGGNKPYPTQSLSDDAVRRSEGGMHPLELEFNF